MSNQWDQALDAAVARMTEAAQSRGRNNLIMTTQEWVKLVLSGTRGGVREFGMEMVNRVADAESIDIVNGWLALAMDIWNAMPEPVRRLDLRRMEANRLNDIYHALAAGEIEAGGLTDHEDERHGKLEYAQL